LGIRSFQYVLCLFKERLDVELDGHAVTDDNFAAFDRGVTDMEVGSAHRCTTRKPNSRLALEPRLVEPKELHVDGHATGDIANGQVTDERDRGVFSGDLGTRERDGREPVESRNLADLRSSSRIGVPVSTDAVAIDACTEQDASD